MEFQELCSTINQKIIFQTLYQQPITFLSTLNISGINTIKTFQKKNQYNIFQVYFFG